MPAASIAITDLAWSTPDGRPLISNLSLNLRPERTGLVGRNGVGKTTLLKLIAGELRPQAGSLSVQGRIAVLRQSLQPAPEETIADLFGVRDALAILARAEAGRASEADLAAADWTLEDRMTSALARVGLAAEPTARLAQLSGGQRTRAALAAMLFAQPDMLLLDEPTNNLDREGRAAVAELLSGWRAGALVVSHDRQLLEAMDAIVELTSLGATRYGGGWSRYQTRKALQLAAAEHDLDEAEKRVSQIAGAAQAQAERKARKDGAGKRKAAKGDAPRILLGRRKERAEGTGADQARLTQRRMRDAEADIQTARERIEILIPLAVTLPSTGLAAGKEVLRLAEVSAGYAPDAAVLHDLSLELTGPERLAVVGPNGSGKSTLLAVITGALAPLAGEVRRPVDFALLDQTVSLLDATSTILANFRRLNPAADEQACRAALARFMFRADAALQTVEELSGGQRLRAGLACVLGGPQPPPLLILDEPTNHLDLESVAAVEAGLSAYDGALIVVSHDEDFLAALGINRRLELRAD